MRQWSVLHEIWIKNWYSRGSCPPLLKGGVRSAENFIFGRFTPNPDPLLSTSNKSGQKCLSAHFAISKNISLRFDISEIRSWAELFVRFVEIIVEDSALSSRFLIVLNC